MATILAQAVLLAKKYLLAKRTDNSPEAPGENEAV